MSFSPGCGVGLRPRGTRCVSGNPPQSARVPGSARCVPLPLPAAPVSRPSRVHGVHSRLHAGCQYLQVPESTSCDLTPTERHCPSLCGFAAPRRFPENSHRGRPPALAPLLVAARAPSVDQTSQEPRGCRRKVPQRRRSPGWADPAARGRPPARALVPAASASPAAQLRSAGAEAAAAASAPPAPCQGPGRKRSGRRLPGRSRPAAHLVALVSLQRPDRRLGELHMQHGDVVLPQPPARQPVALLLPQPRRPPRRHLKLPGVPPRTPLGLQPPLRPRLLGLLQPPPQLRPSRC